MKPYDVHVREATSQRSPIAHDIWFTAKVREALDDLRSAVPNDEVKARFAERRAAALRKVERDPS